jgi:hypothetical protein
MHQHMDKLAEETYRWGWLVQVSSYAGAPDAGMLDQPC